jgi:hypothetical protein
LIGLSGFVFILVLLQIATGYYFVFDAGETAAHIAVAFAYFALMVLAVSGKRMAWRLNRIAGVCGLGLPVLIAVLSPDALFAGIIAIFGFYNHHPAFQGRITPGLSYRVTINQTLIGAGDYYRYSLFRNPPWLPLVRKQIADGPIYACNVPALQVRVEIEPRSGFLRIACQPASGATLTGDIPLDNPVPAVVVTASN